MKKLLSHWLTPPILTVLLLCSCGVGTLEQPPPEEHKELVGLWAVSGCYVNGTLIPLSEHEALAELYNSTFLSFSDDGSFQYYLHYDIVYYSGEYEMFNQDGLEYNCYLLKVHSSFMRTLQEGEVVMQEDTSEDKIPYLVTVLEDGLLTCVKYDPLLSQVKAGEEPLIFVRKE